MVRAHDKTRKESQEDGNADWTYVVDMVVGDCAVARGDGGSSAGLADEADPLHRSVPARRRHRHHRADRQDKLAAAPGQPIVDNRGGAAGNIGTGSRQRRLLMATHSCSAILA
jgi:hypothetical protein